MISLGFWSAKSIFLVKVMHENNEIIFLIKMIVINDRVCYNGRYIIAKGSLAKQMSLIFRIRVCPCPGSKLRL